MHYFKQLFHQFFAKIILFFIIISFALGNFNHFIYKKNQKHCAVINNNFISFKKIHTIYYSRYFKKQIQNHHQLSQISNNTSYIKHIHLQILSQIINNILINNYIKKLNFKINVSLLQNKIYKMPIFQINHHFNRAKYLYILNNINIFPKKYENLLIQQLNTLEFLKIIKNSEFILNYEKNFYIKNFFQIRTINKITLSIQKLIHKQHIKISEINKYLKKYNFNICNPEAFKIAFIQIKYNKLKNYTNTKQIKYWYNKNIFKHFNKKNKIYSIIHILLNKKESLNMYHHLQLTIKNIIKSRNTTLKHIQKKINPNISVANWFSKNTIPSELNFNAIKSIIFNKYIANKQNKLKKHLELIIINNQLSILIKILGYRNQSKKNMIDSKQEVISKIKYSKSKIKIQQKIQNILMSINNNLNFSKNLALLSHKKLILTRFNSKTITPLIFLLKNPQPHTIIYNTFKNKKGNMTLIVLFNINNAQISNLHKRALYKLLLQKNQNISLKNFFLNLYNKSEISYNLKNYKT